MWLGRHLIFASSFAREGSSSSDSWGEKAGTLLPQYIALMRTRPGSSPQETPGTRAQVPCLCLPTTRSDPWPHTQKPSRGSSAQVHHTLEPRGTHTSIHIRKDTDTGLISRIGNQGRQELSSAGVMEASWSACVPRGLACSMKSSGYSGQKRRYPRAGHCCFCRA